MERYNIKTIALGLALTAGALAGWSQQVKLLNLVIRKYAASLGQECPDGNNPGELYEIYTRAARPPKNIVELETGKMPNELTGVIVSCKAASRGTYKISSLPQLHHKKPGCKPSGFLLFIHSTATIAFPFLEVSPAYSHP